MSEKQVENCNDTLTDWTVKPSKLSYISNRDHKSKCLKSYKLIDYSYPTNEKGDEAYHRFNFKKTTAHKKKYSCWGYGGKCSMCKSNNHSEDKAYRKVLLSDIPTTLNTLIVKNRITVR